MKNLISYYYDLIINDFKKKNDSFCFEVDGKKYKFIKFDGDPELLYNNFLTLKNNNRYCHEIVLNKDNSILTFYNNEPYLLIKMVFNIDKYVDMNEIISYDFFVNRKNGIDWKKLWKAKIDYYEYQMSQISFKYPILKNSFDYYVGLTETSISLINYINDFPINYYVCHKRITYKEKLDDFFNPIEIVIDSRVRDIAEFIKINFINGNLRVEEVYNTINKLNFDSTESILLLTRLIYPSYYFDLYDEIIQGKIGEDKIDFYIKKNTQYEVFLKKIYLYLKTKFVMPNIEWLNF